MRMKFTGLAAATVIAVATLLPVGAYAEAITLRVSAPYGDESERVPVDYALAKLKELMPDVTVALEKIPQTDEYNAKVLAAAASNTLPDVVYTRGGIFRQLVEAGKLADLTQTLAEEGIAGRYIAAMQPQIFNFEGKSYLLPDEGSWTAAIFYNTAVLADAGVTAPTNFAELLAATKVLAAKGYTPLSVPLNGNWMAVQVLDALVTRDDPRGLTALQGGGAKLSDPTFRRAVERYKELIDAGLVGPRAATYEESVNLLQTGKAAMMMNGAWMMGDLAKSMPDKAGRLGLPFGDAAGQAAVNASGGPGLQGYAAAAGGAHEDIAKKFAAWLAYYVAEAKVIKRAYPSPFTDTAIKYEGTLLPFQEAYFAEAQQYTTMTAFPWGLDRDVDVLLEDTIGEFVTGSMSADDFIATVDAKLARTSE